MPAPATTPPPAAPPQDASRKEVILYALANIGPALGTHFFGVINLLAIVAMGISPLLMGMVTGIKSIWDGITDPVMAHITDSTRSRWGRRRPYILLGGIGQLVFLLVVVLSFPRSDRLQTNAQLAKQGKTPAALQRVTQVSVTNVVAAGVTNVAPVKAATGAGPLANIKHGLAAFSDPANKDQRTVIVFLLIAYVIFTTLTTITSVPYYALGIELSPSYNGRTQVVTYRAMIDKIVGLIAPWVTPFCFLLYFKTALDGLIWVALLAVVIGVPCLVLMVTQTRERTHLSARKGKKSNVGLFTSIWLTIRNKEFLRVFLLYQFIGFSNGLFAQIGSFLNIYWVMGNVQRGATLGAGVAMTAWVLGFISLPILNWACRRFQKHVTLRVAVLWMSIGCVMKWWCMNPKHPEYQFVLPFFFSVGIGSTMAVLSTMMADVTDIDELRTGSRREGMFGAAMAFLLKTIGSVTPVLAGAILVLSGFDPALKQQTAGTIFNMRLLYSFVPGGMLLLSLLLLWRYPLTAQRMTEIKAELQRRHAEADTEPTPAPAGAPA